MRPAPLWEAVLEFDRAIAAHDGERIVAMPRPSASS